LRGLAGRVVAVDQHPPAGRLDEAIDHAQQGGTFPSRRVPTITVIEFALD